MVWCWENRLQSDCMFELAERVDSSSRQAVTHKHALNKYGEIKWNKI